LIADQSAIREHRLAVDPLAISAAQQGDDVRNIRRLAQALVMSAIGETGDLLRRLAIGEQRRVRHALRHRVD